MQVMYNDLVAHTNMLVDEKIYKVKAECEGKYQLYERGGFFNCEWFVPVHYSTEVPVEGKQLLITDHEDKMSIIIPRAVKNTEIYNNIYKVYSEEREDFYVVLVTP